MLRTWKKIELPESYFTKKYSFQVTLYVAFWASLGVRAMPSNPAPYHGSTTPTPYNYEYGVNSPHHGSVFSQKETRDNYNTDGEYRDRAETDLTGDQRPAPAPQSQPQSSVCCFAL